VTPQGTSGAATTAATFSNTPLGSLVSGVSSARVFSTAGRIFFDGVGHIYASPTSGLLTNTPVGTYNVTSDCGITVSLIDALITGSAGLVTGNRTVGLEGEIVDTADTSEIDLVSTGSTAPGALVTMVKTAEFGSCSNASLNGNFGTVGQGMIVSGTNIASIGTTTSGTTTPGTTAPGITSPGTGATTGGSTSGAFSSGVTGTLGTPFTLVGRFVADGSGNLITDTAAASSSLRRSLTGTYQVNADCTGTAHFIDSSGAARNISFALVNAPRISAVQTSVRQDLNYVFSDTGVIGSGVARQQ